MKTKDQLADLGTKHLSKQRQLPTQVDQRVQGLKLISLDDQTVGVSFLLIAFNCYFRVNGEDILHTLYGFLYIIRVIVR